MGDTSMADIQTLTAEHIFLHGTPFTIVASCTLEDGGRIAEGYVIIADLPHRLIREHLSQRFRAAVPAGPGEGAAPVVPFPDLHEWALEWVKGSIDGIRFRVYQDFRHFPPFRPS